MSTPPRELFEEGQATAILEIRIHQDENGRIWSVHQFRSQEDETKTFSWPGGGARQLSYAFLTEALRREAYASILVELTKESGYLKNYKDSDAEKKAQIEARLSQSIQTVMSNTALKMGDAVAKEILQMLSSQV